MSVQSAIRAWSVYAVVLFGVLGAIGAAQSQIVIYVNAAAPAGGNGLSWATAFRELQAGLTAADQATTGAVIAEVWVAGGMYVVPSGTNTRFEMNGPDIQMYGGFAGSEAARSERNVSANSTVLSGDRDGDDAMTGDRTDNAMGVLHVVGATRNNVIDGFTITGGGRLFDDNGGLYLDDSEGQSSALRIVVRGCTFMGHRGSALTVDRSGVVIDGCAFSNNSSGSTGGGAIRTSGSGGRTGRFLTIRDSTFTGNLALSNSGGSLGSDGGAIHTGQYPARIEGCTFSANMAENGGAVLLGNECELVRCDFQRNFAQSEGGAVNADSADTPLNFVSCSFRGNRAGSAGAVSFTTAATLTNCVLVGNQVTQRGGAIAASSANTTAPPVITLRNCTLTDNRSTATTAHGIDIGGTIDCTLINSIVWSNGGALEANQVQRVSGATGSYAAQFTLVQGAGSTLLGSGPGNLADGFNNPAFVRPPSPGANGYGDADDDYGNLDLLPPSAAIDSGDAAAIPLDVADADDDGVISEPLPLDIAGRFRTVDHPVVSNTGLGFPPVDRGAYEAGSSVPQQRLYVRAEAPVTGDGNTWATALPSLASALERAALPGSGVNQIWVGRGTYRPDGGYATADGTINVLGTRNRAASFSMQSNLAIYGGFAGNETSLSQRTAASLATNPTVLSGDLNGDDLGDLARDDNSVHVVKALSVSSNALLDGFVVRAGRADSASQSPPGNLGGGLLCSGASPVIRSCVFEGNQGQAGGAAAVVQGGTPSFEACEFGFNESREFNLAGLPRSGGAVFTDAASPMFRECRFTRNTAAAEGGALAVVNGGLLRLVNCEVSRNSCGTVVSGRGYGGAVYSAFSVVEVWNSTFQGNRAAYEDAAIHAFQGGTRLAGCVIIGNHAAGGAGAVAQYDGYLSVANCSIVANTTENTGGGAIHSREVGQPTSVTVHNSVLWGNSADGVASEQTQLRFSGSISLVLNRCIVQGLTGGLGGTQNSPDNPRFIREPAQGADGVWGTDDDDFGDLRATPASPTIDSGDSNVFTSPNSLNDAVDLDGDGNTTEALPLDLAGNPRFFDHPSVPNTGSGSPPVDRGAYEFIPPVCPPPNDDGVRNWVSSSGGLFGDVNNWLPCVPDVGSHLLFDSGAASVFEVTLPPSAVSSRTLRVRSGDVTFTGAAAGSTLSLTDTSQFSVRVGDTSGRAATLRLGRGAGPVGSTFAPTLTADEVVVGDAAGSSGLLDLADAATLRPSGQLTIGNAGAGLAFIRGGSLLRCFNVGIGEEPGSRGDLTIDGPGSILSTRSSLVVKRGSLNVSGGGQVAFRSAAGIVSVFKSGELTGTPTIPGDLECFGTLSPGDIGLLPVPGTPSVGTLRVSGDYFQFGEEESDAASTGILRIEVGGTGVSPAPEFDRLIVDGAADLGSGLASDGTTIIGGGGLVVSAIDGLAADIPPVGADPDTFRVRFLEARGMTPAQFTTRFGVALLPAVPGREDVFFTLIYNPPGVPFGAVELGLAGFAGGGGGLSVDPTLPVIDPALVGEPTASALGDLNNDGLDDLVVVYRRVTSGSGTSTLNNNAYIFINQGLVAPGGAIFGPSIVKNLPNGPLTLRTTDVAIAVIDDNEFADLSFSHDVGDDGVPGFVTFIANSGGGSAASFVTVAGAGPDGRLRLGAGRGPSSLVVANLKDRDAGGVGAHSRPELAIANRVDATVQVFELATAEAGAAFAYTAIAGVGPIPTGQAPVSMTSAGVDSDNGKRSDLLIANQGSNSVTVIPGGSTGARYSHGTTFDIGVGSSPKVVLSSRLSGSGDKASFVTINGGTVPLAGQEPTDPGSVSVVVKTGGESVAASYQPSVDLPVGLNPFEAAITDLDGDGDLDVSVLTNVGTVMSEEIKLRVLRNDTIVPGSPGSSPQVTFATSGDEVVNPLAVFARSGRIVPGTPDASEGIVIVSGTGEGGPVDPDDPATYFRGGIYPLVPTTRPPTCLADFNADGNLDPDDLGDYINCYFSTPPCDRADITGDGGVDPDDLGDFINAYFGGC